MGAGVSRSLWLRFGRSPSCPLPVPRQLSAPVAVVHLQSLGTFGFRGEALSSLCAVSDLSVVTRTPEQEVGVRLSYDHMGRLAGQAPAARSVGTTVAVRQLFHNLPVRHKEFQRNLKREYAKLIALLQAYALLATGVRLLCTNQTGSGSRTTVVSTQGSQAIRWVTGWGLGRWRLEGWAMPLVLFLAHAAPTASTSHAPTRNKQ